MRAALLLLLVACTTNNTTAPQVITDTVTCPAVTVAQGAQGDGSLPACTISTTCSDASKYVLDCRSNTSDAETTCRCAIDDVVGDAITFLHTMCSTAPSLTPTQIERAWLDCGVDLTLPK